MYRDWQILSIVINKKSTKSFAIHDWPDLMRKAFTKLDCPHREIIHLFLRIKK